MDNSFLIPDKELEFHKRELKDREERQILYATSMLNKGYRLVTKKSEDLSIKDFVGWAKIEDPC